jgi:hypothetical protein
MYLRPGWSAGAANAWLSPWVAGETNLAAWNLEPLKNALAFGYGIRGTSSSSTQM